MGTSSNDSTDDSRRQTTTWRRAEPWRTDAWHGRQYSDASTTWTSGNWSREATRDHSSWWQRDAWNDGWMGDRDWRRRRYLGVDTEHYGTIHGYDTGVRELGDYRGRTGWARPPNREADGAYVLWRRRQ